ncbi:MAG: putative HTH-type transcriptional regulator [Candidatus Bathyarchaeota archaeon BA1]|nr:MAG: putative HTH-type transcriptional regulator [Candidatus Bathyarchaeota archaeon BA1]
MSKDILTGRPLRPLRLLRMLYEQGKPVTTSTIQVKQSELAKQLNISRQALNVHLRKLRDQGHIRTGRGFIDVTENGLSMLGVSVNPVFVFIKVSPLKRGEVYQKIVNFHVQRVFRVAGDMDAILIVEQGNLNEVLRKLASVDGVQDTKSYIAIQAVK